MLGVVKKKHPRYFNFIAQAYRESSLLFYGPTVIPSCRGIQQGDPLGPAFFALVIQPIAEALNFLKLNISYLDDSSVRYSPSNVLKALT